MKGIIFTEFLEMVENQFGLEIQDKIIMESNLKSEGIYTSVGTYPHQEMITLVTKLSEVLNIEVPTLLKVYGKYLFKAFAKRYVTIVSALTDPFELLEAVEGHIHGEVRKLYPDAELPSFDTEQPTEERLHMLYRSSRKMSDLAEGLIEGCFEFFNQTAQIERKMIAEDGQEVLFIITKEKIIVRT